MFSLLQTAGSLFSPRKRDSRPSRRMSQAHRPAVEAMEDRKLMTAMMLINSPSTMEGTGGSHQMNFTVNLATPSSVPVSVHYSTVNKSAQASSDFLSTSGTLTFAPGQTARTIPVTIIGDSKPELTEAFGMALSSPTNAVLLNNLGIGIIGDDDTAVATELTINDVSMTRGLNGSKTMNFTVGLTSAANSTVNVTVSTQNVTAVAGADYQGTSRVLSFAPGERTKRFSVTIYGTSKLTQDKLFHVNLSKANIPIGRASGVGILRYGA